MPKMWEPAKVHSNVGEWEHCRTREGARDAGSWGPLPGQVHRPLFNKHFDFFFFLILENLLGLHVQLLSSDFENVFST